ncbi:transmembrane protein 45A isoform X2 [Leopardus geoffroyi]|uniref:transmembrane protein 45A isoform X2 n=1 Tax=Leopardus geoffroyi TaxID=46844 RepID=UPI001E2632CE|nr:transmembrane protein 45A isoform X2 [Leopardus geoffroyi]XP_045357749.1 transmembrane protein 45A isoform X2 [Leopardus geoffroyi]XP_045357750.1 transmembrane protein 45A isoform X2 [Leopardus geoffroyi]
MGSFRGHALPGTFFITMGIWWTIKCTLKYACKKHKRTSYLGSKALFHRMDIVEGIVIICMALTGMLGEQFVAEGPHLALYNYKEGQWVQLLSWHHSTMYFFFGLVGVANILRFIISSFPISLIKLLLSNALFVEAFILYNHTHGREMLDIFVHQLLVLAVFVAALIGFLEFFVRNNVIVELLQMTFILLQGSWFWQIGFVLYPPSGGPAWDSMDHDNIMFLSTCFCWHYTLHIVIVGVIYAFVTWLVKSRLKRFCSSEVGLLKNTEREQESEEEM